MRMGKGMSWMLSTLLLAALFALTLPRRSEPHVPRTAILLLMIIRGRQLRAFTRQAT